MQFVAIPSLRWRLVAVMCLAYIIVAVATSVLSFQVQQTTLRDQLTSQARGDAALLAAAYQQQFASTSSQSTHVYYMHSFLQALSTQTPGMRYAFVSVYGGQVLAAVGHKEPGDRLGFDISNPSPSSHISGGRVVALFPIQVGGVGGGLVGYAGVILSDDQIQRNLRNSLLWDSGLRFLGLVIFILLSLVISRYILGPLGVLARAAEAIRSGQYSARATIHESTELGTVAEAFNDMAVTLEQRILHLSFLAEAGSILPNTFRESGDIDRVLRQFCARLDAYGVCLTFPEESADASVYYSLDPDLVAWQRPALAFGERATAPTAGIEEGYAVMAVPVVEGAEFVTARDGQMPFTVEEQQVITNFAYQMGIAADNARLFDAQQEALRVKDQFLSIVSHELRTPLTTIKGYAQMLRRKLSGDPEGSRFAETIDAQVGRLSRLVDDLLDVTRFARGQFELKQERMEIAPVLEDVVTRFRLVAPNHHLELHLNGAQPSGDWDHDRIEQVMNNLVGNAIKYSPEGGTIAVGTECSHDEVIISVRDQGMGIPEEDQERLFERFFRGSAEGQDIKGMGLGLYVTKRIVEAHGGTISVHSTSGEGSEFRFTLPLVRQPAVVD